MTTCVPIKELKNTASFSKLVEESSDPVIVTKNGYEKFAVMTIEKLDALRMEAARTELYRHIDAAEADIREGRVVDGWESIEETRKKYAL